MLYVTSSVETEIQFKISFILFLVQKRLAGYSLYVTNSSVTGTSPKPTNGHLCFHHTGTTLPSINQTVDCNVLGQYIVIYNERNSTVNDKYHGYSEHAWLELCDVQIYG